MDEQLSKPHLERLKSDVELKVAGEDFSSAESGIGTADNGAAGSGAVEIATPAYRFGSGTKDSTTPPDSRDVRVAILAERKAKEQTFLAEYKKKQIRTRIKFGVCTTIVLALFWSAMYFVCSQNEKAVQAVSQFQPVAMFASLGENDMAYYMISNFTTDTTDNTSRSKLVEERVKILNHGIENYEASGRPAIFTRLGAEDMLAHLGNRDAALKFGDPLIARFPNLPSNYLWRARIDFGNLDLSNAINDYQKAAEIIERSPKSVGRAFYGEFHNATLAAIDLGQFDQAQRFLALAEKYGLGEFDKSSLTAQMLMAKSDGLAIAELKKTDLWNEKYGNYNQHILKAAAAAVSGMNWCEAYKEGRIITDESRSDLSFAAALRQGDYAKAQTYVDNAFGSMRYAHGDTLRARLALAQEQPQDALNLISRWTGEKSYYAKKYEFIRAEALLKLHRPAEVIKLADDMTNSSGYGDKISNAKFYLPYRTIKAKALYDSGKYQDAVTEVDKILALNQHLIEPRLIKIDALRKLNNTSAANTERTATLAELQLATSTSAPGAGAIHDR